MSSPEAIAEAKRRHPAWFPARRDDMLTSQVDMGNVSESRRDLVLRGLALNFQHMLDVHDARRRGRTDTTSWFQAKMPSLDFEYGATVITRVNVDVAGHDVPATKVIVSQISDDRPKERTAAWAAYMRVAGTSYEPWDSTNAKCSNPSCPLAAAGIAPRLKACARCGKVKYCMRACQTEHWPAHKPECKK